MNKSRIAFLVFLTKLLLCGASQAAAGPDLFGRTYGGVSAPNEYGGDEYVGRDPSTYLLFHQLEVDPYVDSACGTTSLAIVLANSGHIPHTLDEARSVDRQVRVAAKGTRPLELCREAEARGLSSRILNGSTLDDLRRRLEAGNHVMALVDSGEVAHWVTVIALEHEHATGRNFVHLGDPNPKDQPPGTRPMRPVRLTWEAFERQWRRPLDGALGSSVATFSQIEGLLLIFDEAPDRLPFDRNASGYWAQSMADGKSDIENGVTLVSDGDVKAGVNRVAGGIVKELTALPAAAGRAMEWGGELLWDESGDAWVRGGTIRKTAAVLGYAASACMMGVGGAVKRFGNGLSWIGNKVGEWIAQPPPEGDVD